MLHEESAIFGGLTSMVSSMKPSASTVIRVQYPYPMLNGNG